MNDFTLQDFIRNGYVVLKPDFPDELHQIIHRKTQLAVKNGNPGNKIFEQIPELHKIFDHVEIRRTLSQIVGANYIMHPHRHCHVNPPNSNGQELHQDGTPRQFSGWNHPWRRHHHLRLAMAFYYPHDVSETMGGTSVIPSSQYYNNLHPKDDRVEFKIVGSPGTIAIVHYDIWHRATINSTNSPRYMMKFLFQRCTEPSLKKINDSQKPPLFDRSVDEYHWHWFHRRQKNFCNETNLSLNYSTKGLIEQLSEDSRSIVQTKSIYHLAQIGGEAVGQLMDALQNGHSEIHRLNIATALSSIGKSSVSGLKDVVRFSGDWWLRATAIDTLGDIGELENDSILLLVESLSDDSAWVRRNAAYALGTVAPKDSEALPELILSTKDKHSFVRINALKSLIRIYRSTKQSGRDYSEIITAYQNALKDQDNRVVEYARQYLKLIEQQF